VPVSDVTLPPQTVQLQGENDTLKQEVLELRAKIIVLENENNLWQMEKKEMQEKIDELKDYETPDSYFS